MAAKKRVAKKRTTKKKVDKRRVGTSTRKPSKATGLPPGPRLKRRRKANTEPGYYPNPTVDMYIIRIVHGGKSYYYDGTNADSNKRKAVLFRTAKQALEAAMRIDEQSRRAFEDIKIERVSIKKK